MKEKKITEEMLDALRKKVSEGMSEKRFRHTAEVGEIDDHSSSYSCEAVIKELFKFSECALYRVFTFGVYCNIVLMNVEVFDLVQRNTHHLTRQGKIEATLVLNELFAGSIKNGV